MASLVEIGRRQLGRTTHRLRSLPIVLLSPHSRCNCRCVMCDIWRANANRREISRPELARHVESLRRLHVERVVLTGGEPLMHSSLWSLCELLREELDARITLLSTGLLLGRAAEEVVRWCDEVIVSLDGSPPVHDAIRNVARAFDRLADGVAAVRRADGAFRVSARCVVQRRNHHDLPGIVATAHDLGLDRLSFLAADTTSEAFNRPTPWDEVRAGEVALSTAEAQRLTEIVEEVIERFAADFASGWIAESPDKLRRIPRYYLALAGNGELPPVRCNAPWVSTVIEADGIVRPCFFHPPLGTLDAETSLDDLLNSRKAIAFRRRLDVRSDPTCRRCVCSLDLPLWASPR